MNAEEFGLAHGLLMVSSYLSCQNMRCGTLFPSVLRQDPPFERDISAIERVTQDFPPVFHPFTCWQP